jgi:hypothetical protein
MPVKSLSDQSPARRCKMHDAGAAVSGLGTPLHQTSFFKPVNCGGPGTACQSDAHRQIVYRQRTFVQQYLKNREIRKTHPRSRDADGSSVAESPMRLHQKQPQVNAGNGDVIFIHAIKILGIKIKIQAFSGPFRHS